VSHALRSVLLRILESFVDWYEWSFKDCVCGVALRCRAISLVWPVVVMMLWWKVQSTMRSLPRAKAQAFSSIAINL
jgi:hypothetical protein